MIDNKARNKKNSANLWIAGYGDIGRRVASLYQKQGIQTSATVGSKESLQVLSDCKETVIRMNLDEKKCSGVLHVKSALQKTPASIFYFIPPPSQGKQDSRLSRFLEELGELPERIVLISTTGVYGDCNGAWVNETDETKPVADRAIRRAHAEQLLQSWAERYKRNYVILRVPGIYAADRLPVSRVKKGLPIVNRTESPWTNRIHADDLAMACYLAMQKGIENEIINISDGNPSTMTDYFNQVADFANLPRPPQISLQRAQQELSQGMLSYLRESRRVSNRKMLELLGISLRYPSLADGLKKNHKSPLFSDKT